MKEFCIIRVSQTKNGVKIYCRSEAIEEFFRGIANGDERVTDKKWQGIEGYKIYPTPYSFIYEHFMRWGLDLVEYGNSKPNLSFLRAVGLSKGIEFVIPEVYSASELKDWANKARATLQKMKEEYFEDTRFEISL